MTMTHAAFLTRLLLALSLICSTQMALAQSAASQEAVAQEAVASPQIVAKTDKVRPKVGDELTFAITATFLDGDGALYAIDLDEAELPDGYQVLDTGDDQQLVSQGSSAKAGAAAKVLQKRRYYKLKATEAGVWLLPKARLVSATDAKQSYGTTSAIYTIISPPGGATGAAAQPFFKLLPPTPIKKGSAELMPFYQISSLAPEYQVQPWRLFVAVLIAAALTLAAIAFRDRKPAEPVVKERKVTIAELRSELDDAGYRDRSPEQIKESYDAVRATLLSYAQNILGRDLSTKMPADVIQDEGFLDRDQRQGFRDVLATCDAVRFCPDRFAVRERLASTVVAAKAVVLDPRERLAAVEPAEDEQAEQEGCQ